jgi:anti-anti-sigma regulatory factor
MMKLEHIRFHSQIFLHADDPQAREKIAAAVEALLGETAERPALRVILDGESMPSDTIAGLVAGLRRLREHGGALAVAPVSTAVTNMLAVTGLNRVFALPIDPEPDEPRPRPPRKSPPWRFTAATSALVLALAGGPVEAVTNPPLTDPVAILDHVAAQNPSLSSFQGRVNIELRMTSFPFIRTHLNGTTYFKRPANYEVVFDRVPRMAKGFDKLFTDVGDPSSWERRFVITYAGQAAFGQRQDIALHMVQRVRGMIDHETVLVDPDRWTIDSIRYDYYNGGHITLTQTFSTVGGYVMVVEQQAEIKIPYASAVAHGTYSDYKTNVALDDAVFVKQQ